jgi:hypothetical protein
MTYEQSSVGVQATTTPPRFQFGLSSLLAVVALCAVVMAAAKALGPEIVLGFSGLAWSCGFVLLLALALIPFDSAISRQSDWKVFVFSAILFCGLEFAFSLFDFQVNQPQRYCSPFNGEWLLRAAVSATAAPLAAIFLLIPAILHPESRASAPKDRAYYPRLVKVWRGMGLLHVRLILMIGVLLVVGYYAATEIQVLRSAEWSYCRTAVPGPRVWISCHLLWGVLWLADSASRPNRGMMKVAVGYLCIVGVFLLLF